MPSHRFIPRHAIVLGVAIGIVIVCIALKIAVDLRDETWETALRTSRDVGTSISHDVERSIQSYDLSLQAVVSDLRTAGVMELPAEIRGRVLFDSSVKATYLGPISVLDKHGRIYLDSTRAGTPRRDFHDSDVFQFHETHDDLGLHIGRAYRDADGIDRLPLSRRLVMDDGRFAGVVIGSIELAYFNELFAKIDFGGSSVLSLLSDDGTMLRCHPCSVGGDGRNLKGVPLFDEMVRERRGVIQAHSSIDGVERQYVFQHVGTFPLIMVAAQSIEDIYDGWRERARLIALLTIALLTGCGALALILQGELKRRVAVESELFAQGERLHVMLESIADAVLSTDRDGRVLYMNPVAERMSGWTAAEAVGRPVSEVLQIAPRRERGPHGYERRSHPAQEGWRGVHRRGVGRSDPRPTGSDDRCGHGLARRHAGARADPSHVPSRAARRVDRLAEPRALPGSSGPGHRPRSARRTQGRGAVHRSRPLQDRQRFARPSRRRPAADRGRATSEDLRARQRHGQSSGRRTSSSC